MNPTPLLGLPISLYMVLDAGLLSGLWSLDFFITWPKEIFLPIIPCYCTLIISFMIVICNYTQQLQEWMNENEWRYVYVHTQRVCLFSHLFVLLTQDKPHMWRTTFVLFSPEYKYLWNKHISKKFFRFKSWKYSKRIKCSRSVKNCRSKVGMAGVGGVVGANRDNYTWTIKKYGKKSHSKTTFWLPGSPTLCHRNETR